MLKGKPVTAIVPARGGSKGIPGKNLLKLGGDTLCARAAKLGLAAKDVDRVIVSSDDDAIRKDILLVFEAKKQYPREFFVKQKALGKLQDDADPESLADYCDAVVQGASLLAKLHRNEAVVRRTFDHAIRYLESLKK